MNFLPSQKAGEEGPSRGTRLCYLPGAEDVGPVASGRSPFFPQESGHHLDGKVINLFEGIPEGQSCQKEGSQHLGSNYS